MSEIAALLGVNKSTVSHVAPGGAASGPGKPVGERKKALTSGGLIR